MAMRGDRFGDPLIVDGNHDIGAIGVARPVGDMDDHRLSGNVGQRLARQPGGGVTGRNDDDETHGFSSSSAR